MTYVCDFCQSLGATVINDEGLIFHKPCFERFCEQHELTGRRGCQPLTTGRFFFKRVYIEKEKGELEE